MIAPVDVRLVILDLVILFLRLIHHCQTCDQAGGEMKPSARTFVFPTSFIGSQRQQMTGQRVPEIAPVFFVRFVAHGDAGQVKIMVIDGVG